MSAWSVNATNSDFSFMDMTYGPPSGEFDDGTVYICVEVRGGSACPEWHANVIDSYDVDGFATAAPKGCARTGI